MRLIRGRRVKPLTDLQIYAEQFKEQKNAFLKKIDDSRYSLFAIEVNPKEYVWEANFCGSWIATHKDIGVVINKMRQHYEKSGAKQVTV